MSIRKITHLNIWDLDGTLIDSSHRYRTRTDANGIEKIDLDYWIANEDKTYLDSVLPLAATYQKGLDTSYIYTIAATARIWCEQTEAFVNSKLGAPDMKISRRDRDDTRGGAALKIVGIKRLLNLRQFAGLKSICIYEDNYSYLQDIAQAMPKSLAITSYFIPSNQGH